MKECCELAQIRTYKPFEIVYAEDRGRLNSVYFILSGNCAILQCLKMNRIRKSRSSSVYELQSAKEIESASRDIVQKIFHMDDSDRASGNPVEQTLKTLPETNDDAHNETKVHFVEIGTFSCGATFGLGEQMEDRVIMAKHNGVQCLMIPRYWLFQKQQNVGNIWHRAKIYLNFTLPCRQKVFKSYVAAKKWKNNKRRIVQDTYTLKPTTNPTRIENVPVTCRVNDFQ